VLEGFDAGEGWRGCGGGHISLIVRRRIVRRELYGGGGRC
jgi:hypothetical protein